MKKLMIPVALVLMGTGAAFAGKAVNGSKDMISPTYRVDENSGLCLEVDQTCSEMPGDVCTWSGDGVSVLHKTQTSPTECGAILFKP